MEKEQEFIFQIELAKSKIEQIKQEIAKVIVGQIELVDSLLIALFSGGHLLLEGAPGVAKTLTVNTFARAISCDFKRVQFTPDLLPADLTGTSIYDIHTGKFSIKKGPIFTQLLLADEINRAPAKVQSALLEVMQEKQVTISGKTIALSAPFMVLATQNPLEQEGTYPLSEAQIDRYMMKVKVEYPGREEEKLILARMGKQQIDVNVQKIISIEEIFEIKKLVDAIYIDEKIVNYILDIIFSTREPKNYQVAMEGLLEYGASPRASLALQLASKARACLCGRAFVIPLDVKEVCYSVLRHRLKLSYEAEAEGLKADDLIFRILEQLPIP